MFTTNRDSAVANEEIELIGLEQPQVAKLLHHWANLPLQERALVATGAQAIILPGVLTGMFSIEGDRGLRHEQVVWLGVSIQGERSPQIESVVSNLRKLQPSASTLDIEVKIRLLRYIILQILQRELGYNSVLIIVEIYYSKLIG